MQDSALSDHGVDLQAKIIVSTELDKAEETFSGAVDLSSSHSRLGSIVSNDR